MNPEDVKNILEYLLKTGEFLATKSYLLAYKKAIFYGVSDLILALFFLVIFYLGVKNISLFTWLIRLDDLSQYEFERIKENIPKKAIEIDTNYPGFGVWLSIIMFILIPVSFALMLVNLVSGLNWLINPELGAIQILVNFFN